MSVMDRHGSFRHIFSLSLIFFSIPISSFAAAGSWQGPYIGAFFGGGFGTNEASTNAGSVTGTSYFTSAANIRAVNNAGTWSDNPNTLIGGIQAGHDWVYKQLVYGVATDYSLLPLNSSNRANNNYPGDTDEYSVYTSMSTNWLFTLRGKLGYQTIVHWPSLFYVTGGMALTQLKVNNSFRDSSSLAGAGGGAVSENQIGWTAGAGVELATFDHVSLQLEYLYVQIPSVKVMSSISNSAEGFGISAQSLNSPYSTVGEFRTSLLKLGLNYRFDE